MRDETAELKSAEALIEEQVRAELRFQRDEFVRKQGVKEGTHPEDDCQDCGGRNPCWHAPSELWNKVMGSPNGIICPRCFQDRADAMGITVHTVVDVL